MTTMVSDTVTIGRDDLIDAMNTVMRAVPSRPTAPILAGVRITTEDGVMVFAAFDYETAVIHRVGVETGGVVPNVVVAARLLRDIAKNLPKKPVVFSYDGNGLGVTCGAARFTLPTLPFEDYPKLPEPGELFATVPAGPFAEAVKKTAVAASKDSTLPMLTGVQVSTSSDGLVFAATDRFRLSVTRVTVPGRWLEAPILPVADVLAKAVAGYPAGDVELFHGGGMLSVCVGSTMTHTRTLDANFPQWEKLFPTELAGSVVFDVAELANAVRRVVALAGRAQTIRLEPAGGAILVSVKEGQDVGVEASDEAAADVDGDPPTVFVNGTYLLDGLSGLGEVRGRISMQESATRPVVLTGVVEGDDTDPDHRYLLMPVRG